MKDDPILQELLNELKVDKNEYCKNESNDWKIGYDCALIDLLSLNVPDTLRETK